MLCRSLIGAAALFFLPAALAAQTSSDPAAAFGARESVEAMALSPDGARIAYVAPAPQGTGSVLYTVDLASPAPRVAAYVEGNQRFYGCRFSGNTRLICTIYAMTELNGYLLPVTRTIAVDANGENAVELADRDSSRQLYGRLSGGGVIDLLPGNNDDEVLMTQVFVPEAQTGSILGRNSQGIGVVRMNTRTRRSSRVESPRNDVARYITDGRGVVRMLGVVQGAGASGMDSTRISFMYRRAGSRDWQDFGVYDFANEDGMLPVAVDPTLDAAYVFAKLNGRSALYRVSLDGSMRRELVASNDSVDVDGLLRIGRSGRVVGASYATERRETIYFDPELRALAERLHRSLPNGPLINFVDSSEDESKLLILASGDDNPGRYYLYDVPGHRLTPVLAVRQPLENVTLAHVRPITYPAADGTQIPGYLTLPTGGAERGLPAIVMPHGGPGARDEWGFDWLAQFFANRGYAVLQPNFRGSSGYGDAWFQQNGFRSWRTAIGDVNDAGRWLVAQGIADPAKLAIFGWSYGGYAALQSNVLDPNLFKAVVAVAPVTDLDVARNEWRDFTNAANVRDFFGEGPHIREGSPAQNAAAIRAPVLMFHGTFDRNVGIRQSRLMDERLRAAGHRSQLVEYPQLDHQLDDSSARTDMLRRSDAFLRQALGLPPAAAH